MLGIVITIASVTNAMSATCISTSGAETLKVMCFTYFIVEASVKDGVL